MLELKTSLTENILDIELRGSLDSQSASDFKAWVLEKNVQGYNMFALNCQDLEFISSRGIGALIEIRKLLASRQSHMALYHLSPEVLNLLKFLKITDEIIIKENLNEIVQTYSAGAAAPKPEELHDRKKAESPQTESEDNIKKSSLWDETLQKENPVPETAPENEEMEEIIDLRKLDDGFSAAAEKSQPAGETTESFPPVDEHIVGKPAHPEKESKTTTAVEEYIDLSKSGSYSGEPAENEIITNCPNCNEPLRVNQSGQYLCPECRTKFRYPLK